MKGPRFVVATQYSKNTSKIAIHHNGKPSNLNNPAAAVRAIYQYHTQYAYWGDIGYNYIIAPDGTILKAAMVAKAVCPCCRLQYWGVGIVFCWVIIKMQIFLHL